MWTHFLLVTSPALVGAALGVAAALLSNRRRARRAAQEGPDYAKEKALRIRQRARRGP